MSIITEPTPLIAAYETSNIDIISGLRLMIVNTSGVTSVLFDDGERLKDASP